MRYFFLSFSGVFLAVLCLVWIAYVNTNFFVINRVRFFSDKIPKRNRIKILQITDLHNMLFDEGNKKLLSKIHRLRPDIVAITGDFVDARTRDFSHVLQFAERLTHEAKVYFVSGNHEWRNKNREKLMQGLKQRNIRILNNENKLVNLGEVKLNIAGVDDFNSGQEDVEKALRGMDQGYYTVLLSHDPMIVNKELTNVDLVLSGHTHGGQIRIPFLGALILPRQGALTKYDKGVFRLPEGPILYIDSGLGTSAFPVRFWCQAQVSLITLKGTGI